MPSPRLRARPPRAAAGGGWTASRGESPPAALHDDGGEVAQHGDAHLHVRRFAPLLACGALRGVSARAGRAERAGAMRGPLHTRCMACAAAAAMQAVGGAGPLGEGMTAPLSV